MKYIKKAPKQEFSNFGTFPGAGRTPKTHERLIANDNSKRKKIVKQTNRPTIIYQHDYKQLIHRISIAYSHDIKTIFIILRKSKR